MSDAKHTPTPWEVDGWYLCDGFGTVAADVRGCRDESGGDVAAANAEFIARAVNSHADLVWLVQFALSRFCDPRACDDDPAAAAFKQRAEAVLPKAKGEAK